ncbi:MAG: hypothetical protein WBQ94_02430 [Terracidiphilus sp.]
MDDFFELMLTVGMRRSLRVDESAARTRSTRRFVGVIGFERALGPLTEEELAVLTLVYREGQGEARPRCSTAASAKGPICFSPSASA